MQLIACMSHPLFTSVLLANIHMSTGASGVRRQPARATARRAEASNEPLQLAAGVTGCLAAPLTLYSEFVLKTTGSGLPPGPGGLVGAAEGVSYLVSFPPSLSYAIHYACACPSGLLHC